jgi:hypothetical protein
MIAVGTIGQVGRIGLSASRKSTLWTPDKLGASLALWLDAADASTITLNGSTVSQWNDKSGNARHATQATAASQPTYVSSDALLNSRPTVKVLADAGLVGLIVPETSYREVFCVGYYGNGIQSLATNTNTLLAGPSGAFNFERVIVLTNTSELVPYSGMGSNFTGTVYKNGDTVGTSTLLPLPATSMRFRRDSGLNVTQITYLQYSPLTVGRNFRGGFGEWVFIKSDLSGSDRQKLEGYLAHKWGTTGGLAADHPFKTLAPAA